MSAAQKQQMEKRFEPRHFEKKWQDFWREGGFFVAETGPDAGEPYCIMIPPPNVTGKLHMGHALQSTLQDLLTRWQRMKGKNALWLPGTDHAGIATQLMVERQLLENGTSRLEVGREVFLERTWDWKEEYHSNIQRQLEKLGASCDWSRERFTMDEGLSVAVREAFVRFYEQGLLTRGEYMVNWSPVLQTAISDLEVEMRTVEGRLYHLAYPVEDSDERLVVATTRPETMLGDTAVAMHPDDERYRHLAGKHAVLPIVGRRIPIVADEHVDPEFGTGLVKITPYHDPNDFELGKRHDLPGVQVIGFDGKMTEDAGPDFVGLDRFEARRKVIELLERDGLVVEIEKHSHNVGHSQRGGEPIEPMVSTQWFLDVEQMAARALAAVDDGSLQLVPSSYDKTWQHWLENIRPWCVSRQLWWGHQIPAWYDQNGESYFARTVEEAREMAGTDALEQDPDVLDTWFSSGLWPMSTLGWPARTEDFATFFPTQVLVTGFDILFFWVARMVMMSLHLEDRVPFETVHLTGLVRDEHGEKMSKTKGNVVDPLVLVEEYGADALRFTLAVLDIPGRDIPLDPQRMAGYRAFGNKIWNATRFALSKIGDSRVRDAGDLDLDGLELPERFILSRLDQTTAEVERRLGEYRFDEACQALYHFFWHELCDWYIELAKPALSGEAARPQVGEVLLLVLDRSLRLLHPVMPHITEELWHRLPGIEDTGFETLALATFPESIEAWRDEEAERAMTAITEVIGRLRSVRKERNLDSSVGVELFLEGGDGATVEAVMQHRALVEFLGRVSAVHRGSGPEDASRDLIASIEVAILVEAQELGEEEKAKLRRELDKIEGEIRGARARLDNPGFLENAPETVVAGNRARLAELEERKSRIETELASPDQS